LLRKSIKLKGFEEQNNSKQKGLSLGLKKKLVKIVDKISMINKTLKLKYFGKIKRNENMTEYESAKL